MVFAVVGCALGGEGLPVVPAEQGSVGWRLVAGPLGLEWGAGAQLDQCLVVMVWTR